jgi:hypothetical protein
MSMANAMIAWNEWTMDPPTEDTEREVLSMAYRLSVVHLAGLSERRPAWPPMPQPHAGPVHLNVRCFRLAQNGQRSSPQETRTFVNRLVKDGRDFVERLVFKGTPCIRLAFLNWRT